ncbi:glycosyltransferase [Agaribacter marinus]|uniref:Glycosyl transferase n=1 Tax=Agaribacter marinus TaxID=1431249 RepID=A0AA37WML1_9ALTE|nr:glycosyltransferase [Agaribacter marinus]GLR72890.1 glycosyl transferase [Agaribacter marinus]
MKKVLFLHKDFIKGGGIERVHQNLSIALDGIGVKSLFFVLQGYGDSLEGFDALSSHREAFRPEKDCNRFNKLITLTKFCKQNQVTSIISATETANIYACMLKIVMPSINVIYTRHCAFDVSDQKLSPFTIRLLYNVFALNGKIVGVSKALCKDIQTSLLFARKSNVNFIPNAVVSIDILKSSENNTDGWRFSNYFIAIGRLVEQKGFDMLIDAYALSKKKDPTLPKLVIVGDGVDRKMLESKITTKNLEHSIFLAGYTINPYFALSNAEAFILSSRHEGMPTVLVESLALNTPVIAFDCPTGPGELINPKNGLLVDNANVGALSEAITNWSSLPNKNLAESVEHFHFSVVANNYSTLL